MPKKLKTIRQVVMEKIREREEAKRRVVRRIRGR